MFDLKVDLSTEFPIENVDESTVTIAGQTSSELKFKWVPHNLVRLQNNYVILDTNAGKFKLEVRGTSVYPKLRVSPRIIDFGVCAVGQIYTKSLTIQNVGYCGTEWSIPALPNGYEVVPMSGTIDKDETVIVDVNFEIGKIKKQFSGDFVIETLGKYITVSVSGVGGVPGLKFNPSFLDFGKREKGKRSSQALEIKNIGDVPMHLRLGQILLDVFSESKPSATTTDNETSYNLDFDMLSSSFGPAKNQWPRVKVQPNSLILNAKQTGAVTVTILFHPDREGNGVHETAIEALSNEGSWKIPLKWGD